MLGECLLIVDRYTGGGAGGVPVAAGVAGLALQGVGLPHPGPGQGSSTVGTGGAGAVDTAGTAAHRVHLELGHVLQLGDPRQLQVERVHHHPGHHVDDVEEQPDEEHDDVVGEDHVVDDEGVDPGNDPPGSEDAHRDQPGLEPGLLLQSEGVQGGAGTDEHSHGPRQGEEGAHEEKVPHVVIANIDKVEREEIISGVAGARLGLLQYVHLEYSLEAAPDGEKECVEGAVPGPGGEVGVEGRGHHGFLIPLQLLALEGAVASRGSQRPGGPSRGGRGVHGSDGAHLRHLALSLSLAL